MKSDMKSIVLLMSLISILLGSVYLVGFYFNIPLFSVASLVSKTNQVTITAEVPSSVHSPFTVTYSLSTINGKVILQDELSNLGSSQPLVVRANLPSGKYILEYHVTKYIGKGVVDVYDGVKYVTVGGAI